MIRSLFKSVKHCNTAALVLLAESTGTGSSVHVRRHMDALISLPRIDWRTVHQTLPQPAIMNAVVLVKTGWITGEFLPNPVRIGTPLAVIY